MKENAGKTFSRAVLAAVHAAAGARVAGGTDGAHAVALGGNSRGLKIAKSQIEKDFCMHCFKVYTAMIKMGPKMAQKISQITSMLLNCIPGSSSAVLPE